jgi:hypothetical protein
MAQKIIINRFADDIRAGVPLACLMGKEVIKIIKVREVNKTFLIMLSSSVYLWLSGVNYYDHSACPLKGVKGGLLRESPESLERASIRSLILTIEWFRRCDMREKLLATTPDGNAVLLERYLYEYRHGENELQLASFVPALDTTEDDILSAIQEILDSGGSRSSFFVKSDA